MFGEIKMTTFDSILLFLKIILVFSVTSMIFNPSVVSIVATMVGMSIVAVLDLINVLRKNYEN